MLELFTKVSLLSFSLSFLMILWSAVSYGDNEEPETYKLIGGYLLLSGMVFGVLAVIALIITW